MIKSTMTYLQFDGNCNNALEFYEEVFSAKVVEKCTLGEAEMAKNEVEANLIMYSFFMLGEQKFGAADISETYNTTHKIGNQMSIWLEIDKEDYIRNLYSNLIKKGCTVIIELGDSFWDSTYAKVQDMFGVTWELNCQK